MVLRRLGPDALELLADRAEAHLGRKLPLTADGRDVLISMADGDGRYFLNLVEEVAAWKATKPLDAPALSEALQKRAPAYDKDREEHYNLISAWHKSVRGSDPDAALYWFCRMLEGGEDPLYLARRMIRAATKRLRPMNGWGLQRANLHWRRRACIWRPRQSPMPLTRPMALRENRRARQVRWRRLHTS
jgi:putative ATPase